MMLWRPKRAPVAFWTDRGNSEPMADTKFIDLDEVAVDTKQLAIKLNGQTHVLSPLSVEDWILNSKAIKRLESFAGDIEKEVDVLIEMITRSFKTMNASDLRKLEVKKLNRLLDIARNGDGTSEADAEAAKEVAKTEANPPTAAQ